MQRLTEVEIHGLPVDRFAKIIGKARTEAVQAAGERLRTRLAGRSVWNVNSTAKGGGVAEMLRSLLAYARGSGIDVRWLVIHGDAEFFTTTKRLHNALHGSEGTALGDQERVDYERTLHENASELSALIRPRDVVILHDPQTAGLIPHLVGLGAHVIWRCHIGIDELNPEAEQGWSFLAPYLEAAHAYVFSRESYIPWCCDRTRAVVIPPTIDPFSAKNQELDEATCRAILVHVGLLEGPPGDGAPIFTREDGSPGRVDRCADVLRLGRAPTWDTPLVTQVSRWDRLKDPVGVVQGFAQCFDGDSPAGSELVLAGPNVKAVADDPEGAEIFGEVCTVWRALPHAERKRIHLVSLPMADVEENAAIVNALQRHSAVVVQKSLREGFGLTVTEAMWKGRAVVASAVGGIQDQIQDGVDGLLVKQPEDLHAFGNALRTLLGDPALAERLGRSARQRVADHFVGVDSLSAYAALIDRLEQLES